MARPASPSLDSSNSVPAQNATPIAFELICLLADGVGREGSAG